MASRNKDSCGTQFQKNTFCFFCVRMHPCLNKNSRNSDLGSSRMASVPDFKLRKSEKIPSSNFLALRTGRPACENLNIRIFTMSVPVMKNLPRQKIQEMDSPDDNWYDLIGGSSGLVQSCGAVARNRLRSSASGVV